MTISKILSFTSIPTTAAQILDSSRFLWFSILVLYRKRSGKTVEFKTMALKALCNINRDNARFTLYYEVFRANRDCEAHWPFKGN